MAPYWILAAFATGIGLSAGAPALTGSWPPVLAGTFALLWLALRRSTLGWLPLDAAISLAACLAAHQALAPPQHDPHVSRFVTAEEVAVEGVVRRVARLWNGSVRLDVAVERLGTGPTTVPVLGLPELQVTALSVGQGDATLLTFAGERYLVDGGGLTGSAVDLGERLVAPALGRLGIRHVNGVILTHDHPDHSAGLPYILEQFGSMVSGRPCRSKPSNRSLRKSCGAAESPCTPRRRGGPCWTGGPKPRSACLPLGRAPVTSTTARLSCMRPSAVKGYCSPVTWRSRDSSNGAPPGCRNRLRFLKLPHHGSRGARTERFLDRLWPRLGYVAAGRGQAYHLPHPASVAACPERGVPRYRTIIRAH